MVCYMTSKDVQLLGDDHKAKLRETKATAGVQTHIQDFQWKAASGAENQNYEHLKSVAKEKANIYEQLPKEADPMPDEHQLMHGIKHSNHSETHAGKLWHPIEAFHSRKLHVQWRFWTDLKRDPYYYKITDAFPDLNPQVGGTKPLSDAGFKEVAAYMKLKPPMTADFLHHMIDKHQGELRIVGQFRWRKFSATHGPIHSACFWRYQFMSTVIQTYLLRYCFSQYFQNSASFLRLAPRRSAMIPDDTNL